MEVDAMTQGPRALVYVVNGTHPATLNMGGGSLTAASHHRAGHPAAGNNTITFGNPEPTPRSPIAIVISSDGSASLRISHVRGEAAQLSGTASVAGAVSARWSLRRKLRVPANQNAVRSCGYGRKGRHICNSRSTNHQRPAHVLYLRQ